MALTWHNTHKRVLNMWDKNGVPLYQYDPDALYYDDTLLLVEGSALDKSKYHRTVTAVGGAAFDGSGVAALSPSRYFTVVGPSILFAAGDDFTIEFNVRDQTPSARWYAWVLSCATLNDTLNQNVAIGFSTTSAANRHPVWINTGLSASVAEADWVGVTAFREYALERVNGIVRWYLDGAPIWVSSAAITHPLPLANSNLLIGTAVVPSWASAAGPIDVRRVRVTSAARYQGSAYTVPNSYTGA